MGAEAERIGRDGVAVFIGADGFADMGVVEEAEALVVVAAGAVDYAGIEQADKGQLGELAAVGQFGEALPREEFDRRCDAGGGDEQVEDFADHGLP